MKREYKPIFTYIIKSGQHYTIGKTIDIRDRICGYLTHNPDIVLIDLFEGNHEPELHSKFEEYRVFPNTKREWFYLTPELIDTIDVQGLEQKYRNQIKQEHEELERQKKQVIESQWIPEPTFIRHHKKDIKKCTIYLSTVIPFGKYKNKTVYDVIKINASYMTWFKDNVNSNFDTKVQLMTNSFLNKQR